MTYRDSITDLSGDLPELPKDWRYSSLSELLCDDRDISYGIVQPGSTVSDGVPVVRVNNIKGGRISQEDVLRVASDIETDYARTRLQGGEVLLTLVGSLGETAVVPRDMIGWNVARAVGVIPVRPEIGSLWVELCLRSPLCQHHIRMWATTTVQATLNLRDVRNLPIPLPPVREREAIADILGSLDDKIELNRRTNETLEAMTRAVFKSWFENFDPVHRNIARKRGKHVLSNDALLELDTLFPDSFTDSDLGDIPTGWRAGQIGEIVKETSERVGGSEDGCVVLSAVSSGHLVRSDEHFTKRVYSKSVANYKRVCLWDFAYNPSRINIGSIGLLEEDICGAVSPVYVVFRASELTAMWLRFHLRRDQVQGEIRQLCSGSVRQSLRYGDLATITLPLPPEPVLLAFNTLHSDLHKHQQHRNEETSTLTSIRDALLPRLLSGEMRMDSIKTGGTLMDITYHYPPELFNLLVDTIPRLVRSKKDVVVFFRGAGVERKDLADIETALQSGGTDLNKFGMTRTVLQRLNERGEAGLRERREVLKRIVEFEDFSTCWPKDQLEAKGLVAQICRVIDVKDSFVRMRQEKDVEKDRHRTEYEKQMKEKAELRERRQVIKKDLSALFAVSDPHKRGKLLEGVLNSLFSIEGISVKEAFVIRNAEDGTILEQIDGVISLDGALYLVEMKWWNKPVGVPEVSQHISRIFLRNDVRGIFISASDYTSPAVETCRQALTLKTIALATVKEFVCLLEGDNSLTEFLKAKVKAAMIEKNPFFVVTV